VCQCGQRRSSDEFRILIAHTGYVLLSSGRSQCRHGKRPSYCRTQGGQRTDAQDPSPMHHVCHGVTVVKCHLVENSTLPATIPGPF
jgi:hypothetical protein